ncbi:patatin-like phospholipase family protein [Bdellovibrionota bacterium FG-1]
MIRTLIVTVGMVLAVSTGLTGCASAPPRVDGPVSVSSPEPTVTPVPSPSVVPAEIFGPPVPANLPSDQPVVNYGPQPIVVKPIVLVLGPGLARGFAYVGAIRALTEARISIGAVLGTEMGALMGALYAVGGKINQFEWALFKFREEVFVEPKGLMSSLFQPSGKDAKFDAALEQVFEKKDLNQTVVPIRIAIQTVDSGLALVLDRGPAVAAVRAAMGESSLFGPSLWSGGLAQAATHVKPFLIAEARDMNLGPVVVIDVMEQKEDMKGADLVIRPDLVGIGAMDFEKRTDAAFRGKKAVEEQLTEIRKLVGMPPEAETKKGYAP